MERSEDLLLQLILNSIYNGIVAINSNGIIRYFNKTAERISTSLPMMHSISISLTSFPIPEVNCWNV